MTFKRELWFRVAHRKVQAIRASGQTRTTNITFSPLPHPHMGQSHIDIQYRRQIALIDSHLAVEQVEQEKCCTRECRMIDPTSMTLGRNMIRSMRYFPVQIQIRPKYSPHRQHIAIYRETSVMTIVRARDLHFNHSLTLPRKKLKKVNHLVTKMRFCS